MAAREQSETTGRPIPHTWRNAMNSYDWELIELLLHKVQESVNVNFAP